MKRNNIRLLVILAVILFIGITMSQLFFLKRAYDLLEKANNQQISIALQRVRRDVLQRYNSIENESAVKAISHQYYVVNINQEIHPDTLKGYLKKEFEKIGIYTDFQFAIYDTLQKKLIFGDYISRGKPDQRAARVKGLPKYAYDQHYFCVYFPFRSAMIVKEMGVWITLSAVLLLIFVFLGYAIYSILQQKRLSEIQRDFVNNMTHEFQTPISTIYLSSEVIKDPAIIQQPQRLISYATIIQDEAIRLKKQVETILQVAKLDKQKINLSKEKLDLEEQLHKVVEYILQAHPSVSKDNIVFRMEQPLSPINADALHLFNIIYNLIDNAIKYSDKKIDITISAYHKKRGLEFRIEDKGIGLKKSDFNKIFHKFYRIENPTINNSKGFGIGLYYVKLVVNAHGGFVTVESAPLQGSIFSVYLPFSQ
ncbi:MAG: sensor histidine kinase [Chitinophagaceae bacterium]|nr:sensor histidine kinase [Chitinophagaceae bacterium]